MSPAPDEPIPEERVAGILARAAELDRDRRESSTVDALRAAALEAGISQSALDAALDEYSARERAAGRSPARPATRPEEPEPPRPGEKSETVGVLLSVFLGGFGGHRFYLKDRKGFLYLPFFWTFVPTLVGLVEAFFMRDRVRAFNRRAAEQPALEPGNGPRRLEAGRAEERDTADSRHRQPCPQCAELILPQARICRFCHSTLTPDPSPDPSPPL